MSPAPPYWCKDAWERIKPTRTWSALVQGGGPLLLCPRRTVVGKVGPAMTTPSRRTLHGVRNSPFSAAPIRIAQISDCSAGIALVAATRWRVANAASLAGYNWVRSTLASAAPAEFDTHSIANNGNSPASLRMSAHRLATSTSAALTRP